jgi:hypothetical protein
MTKTNMSINRTGAASAALGSTGQLGWYKRMRHTATNAATDRSATLSGRTHLRICDRHATSGATEQLKQGKRRCKAEGPPIYPPGGGRGADGAPSRAKKNL